MEGRIVVRGGQNTREETYRRSGTRMWSSSTYIAMTIARQLVPKRCVAPRKLTAHRFAMAAPKRQKPLMVIALGANQGGMRDATHNHHGLSALSKAVYSG